MKIDYNTYELDRRQKIIFLMAGYVCIFICIFLFFRSFILSALCGLLIRFLVPRYETWLARRRQRQLSLQFKDLLTALSSSIESGRQMEEALVEAGDTLSNIYGPESPMMIELEQMKRGILENNESDMALLTSLARRSHNDDIRNFVQVYMTCRGSGGDLTKIISHTTDIMNEKMEISEQIAVMTAQKRLEGRIISAMPFAMLAALNLVSPAYISVLYETLYGRLVMCLCLGGILTGIILMERLTSVEF